MFSPASSPAITPPQPALDANPPSLPVPPVSTLASAPPLHSPATSVPPVVSLAASRPSNSASPVISPATSISPVSSPSSPDSIVVPASAPPIMSDDTTDPPPLSSPPSPPGFLLPAQPLPSPVVSAPPPLPFPFPSAPRTMNSPPTVTFRPPSAPAFPKAKSPVQPIASSPPLVPPVNPIVPFFPVPPPPLPIIFPFTNPPPTSSATPSSPSQPASASEPQMPSSENSSVSPERQLPPVPPAGVLPLAVEVQKPPIFHMSTGLIIGLAIGGAILLGLVLAIVSFLCACQRHGRKKKHDLLEPSCNAGSKGSRVIQVEENPVVPPYLSEGDSASVSIKSKPENPIPTQSIGFSVLSGIFTYEELLVATNGFSEDNLLGQGGFGYVYKGILRSGKEIAVKKLKTGSHQGEREFQAEIEIISRVHHKHLVELVGYCVTGTDILLVYEFVPNNTLESHLHGEGRPVIEWATRLKIALGSARGLAYLHEDCNPAIVHRDIKASNILLDYKFEAKVSDFGLAKIFPNTDSCTHLTTRVVGTFGYLAPEYASSGKLTDKSDVYSFGVILLELITGRPPITATDSSGNQSLVECARPSLAQALKDGEFSNLVDPRLEKNYRDDEMARMITCAAACVRHSGRLRPRMTQIVGAVEGLVSLADIVEDIRPGYTELYSWSGSSNYDAYKYQEDIRNFNLALSSHKYSFCGYSENTSTYGVHLSDSSSEDQQTNQNT